MASMSEGYRDTLLVLAIPGMYLLLVVLGRWLKRRHGVRLGVFYHFFAASLAVYVPAVMLNMPWSFLRHLGAAVVIQAAGFLISLVDRFVWDLYFFKRHGVKVPKFLMEIVEINWRATRLRTNDDFSIEVPNRTIAQQTIINLNRPQRLHAMRVPIILDYAAPPTRVKEVLLHATANAPGVAPEPRPRVYLKHFGDSGVEYEIKFWLDNFERFSEVTDAIRTNMWYGLRRHGIRIPYPTRTLLMEKAPRDTQQELQRAARQFLRQHAFFKSLADEELDALLPRGRVARFGLGESIICQGTKGDSMFILVEGEADVIVEQDGAPKLAASLRAGDCFGEMSLLTGEARRATVTGRTDCEVVEIGKEVLARSLKEHPELLTRLSELLACRRVENEGMLARRVEPGGTEDHKRYTAGFVEKLKRLFEL